MNTSDFKAVRLIVNYPMQHLVPWLKQHIVGSQATILVQTRQQWASDFFLSHYQEPKRDLSAYLEACQEHLLALCEMARTHGYHVKMLPFPISAVFFASKNEISTIPVFDVNHHPQQYTITSEEIAWHYYSEYLQNLEKLSESIVWDDQGNVKIPELLGICTSDGNLATSMPRKWVERENKSDNTIRQNFGHRHIYCLVVSVTGRILLHQRVGGKDNELLWDKSNGGHVGFGEPTVETCLRELQEELSIRFDPKRHHLSLLESKRTPEDHLRFVPDKQNTLFEYGMYDLFLLSGVDECEVVLDETEVRDVKWFQVSEAIDFIENHPDEITPDLKKLLPHIRAINVFEQHSS